MDYLQNNKYISKLQADGLQISWNFLWLGLVGPGHLPPQLSLSCIIDYAQDLATRSQEETDLETIAYSAIGEEQQIKDALLRLKLKEDHTAEPQALRCWQKLLLADLLRDLPTDDLQGLADLTSFWAQFDFPDDSPHVIQALSNSLTPQEYYTQENYDAMLRRHHDWVRHELF